jgi:hypothetical protein
MPPLPFTAEQFFAVFARYNSATWPAQLLLAGLAIALIPLARSGRPGASRLVNLGLALLWAWMGIVYHLGFFRAINPAATLFGILFILEAGVLLWLGVRRSSVTRRGVTFARRGDARGTLGGALLMYALLVYPLLNVLLDHRYPAAPTFGLPCPTTIYTLGLLLWTRGPVPLTAAAIPLVWTIVGTSAALLLGVPQDLGLTVAALLTALCVWHEHRPSGRNTAMANPGGFHAATPSSTSARRPPS